MSVSLLECFQRYNCDKGKKVVVTEKGKDCHNYHIVYEKAFEPFRDEPINILEIGIWKGTSLQAWVDYFPNAQIYGIDIFTRLAPQDIKILDHERVHYIIANSTVPGLSSKINTAWGEDMKFDFIIDDGKHTPEANRLSFSNTINYLKEGGKYFVEDCWPLDIMTLQEKQHSWMLRNPSDFTKWHFDQFMKTIEDYSVERHDLRPISYKPDSYIFEITK